MCFHFHLNFSVFPFCFKHHLSPVSDFSTLRAQRALISYTFLLGSFSGCNNYRKASQLLVCFLLFRACLGRFVDQYCYSSNCSLNRVVKSTAVKMSLAKGM